MQWIFGPLVTGTFLILAGIVASLSLQRRQNRRQHARSDGHQLSARILFLLVCWICVITAAVGGAWMALPYYYAQAPQFRPGSLSEFVVRSTLSSALAGLIPGVPLALASAWWVNRKRRPR